MSSSTARVGDGADDTVVDFPYWGGEREWEEEKRFN